MSIGGTDRDWLLGVLSDGAWHSHSEILGRSQQERGHGLTVHSRAADLRRPEHGGHAIEVRIEHVAGRALSSYRLVSEAPSNPDPSHDHRKVASVRDGGAPEASLSRVEPQAAQHPACPAGDPDEERLTTAQVCGSTDEIAPSSQPTPTESGAGSARVGCDEGDGQLALVVDLRPSAYRDAA